MPDLPLGLIDEADQIAPADIGLHHRKAAGILALDLDRAFGVLQLRHLAEWNGRTAGCGQTKVGEALRIVAHIGAAAQHQRGTAHPLDDHAQRPAFDHGAQIALHILGVEAEAPGSEAIHPHLKILHTVVLHRKHVLCSGDARELGLHLLRQPVESVQIRAEYLHRQIAAHAGEHF